MDTESSFQSRFLLGAAFALAHAVLQLSAMHVLRSLDLSAALVRDAVERRS